MKKLLYCLFIVGGFNYSIAQTGNETLGNPVTPQSNNPIGYNGSTTLSAPGTSLTTGDYNTLLGDGAGGSLTAGLQCVFIGTAAGALKDNDSDNTIIGAFANDLSAAGIDNVIIGARAARASTGSDNTVIGNEAGLNLTNGFDNTIIGEEAGEALTSGDDNVFIGEDAGFNTTTADDNTFVGSAAGRQNTTGFRNAFFGNEAGYDNTIGYRNTFIGDSTGIDIGVGRLNTFVGQGAGAATEHADYNTFVGVQAGGDNNRNNATNNANRNTYIGVFAGFSNRTGEDNVGMGAFSNFLQGYSILNITGRSGAPFTPSSTFGRNRTTFLGAQSFPNNDDVIILGYQGRVDGQYGMVLGNLSRAQGNYSVAIGQEVNVVNAQTMALGGDTNTNRLSVGIGTTEASQNASLELADTDKGFMINKLTTAQRNTMVTTPASGNALDDSDEGLMVYDSDLKSLYIWSGTSWQAVGVSECAAPSTQVSDAVFGTATDTSLTLSGFKSPAGGATGYLIYINSTDTFVAPSDGDTPAPVTLWANGGQQAVYFGTSEFSNLTVTGLNPNTEYFLAIYAYNDCNSTSTYETTGFSISDTTETLASVEMVAGVGIGTTTPSSAMDVDGSLRALNRNSSGTLYKCESNVEGTFGYDTEDKVLKVCTINSGNYEWRALSFK